VRLSGEALLTVINDIFDFPKTPTLRINGLQVPQAVKNAAVDNPVAEVSLEPIASGFA